MKITKLLGTILLTVLITTLTSPTSQANSITYEEKASGSNIVESFTGSAKLVYEQTPSFTVKIPKNIDLDGEGAGQYTVGVKGKIPSKYVVNVVPDETIVMEEENSLLDSITADVTAEKTTWAASELSEDSYTESTNNTIQMQSIDFAKFKGTLNFNVSVEVPKIELKDASDEVKEANNFIGTYEAVNGSAASVQLAELSTANVGDIVYVSSSQSSSYAQGYYKLIYISKMNYVCLYYPSYGEHAEYLGESYKVPEV